jgi:hypothetical protein
MSLKYANQGARHTGQAVTWTRDDSSAQDLTGATITARIEPVESPETDEFASDGTFTLTDAINGEFSWEYGEDDVANWGRFLVQFKATYGDGSYDLSDPMEWIVKKAV